VREIIILFGYRKYDSVTKTLLKWKCQRLIQ